MQKQPINGTWSIDYPIKYANGIYSLTFYRASSGKRIWNILWYPKMLFGDDCILFTISKLNLSFFFFNLE